MPGIKMAGIGSGMSGVVDQIMAAEREPIKNLENRKKNFETKLNLVGDLEGKLTAVKTSLKDIIGKTKFQDYTLAVSDPDVIAGSVQPDKAVGGQWKVEVVKLAENSGTLSNIVPTKDQTRMGVGYLKFETPKGSQSVYINDSNNTLQGIAQAINTQDLGVSATVVQDGADGSDGYRLILSSEFYGNNQDVDFPTIYLLDGEADLYFDKERESKNGLIKVNGFDVQVVGNKLEDVIPGVTLDLKSAKPGKVVDLNLTENYEAIETKLKTFVDSMNGVLTFIQSQNQMNEKTDTSKTLGGDSALRSVEGRLRQMLQSSTFGGGAINRLSQLGVEFNRSGTLEFKQDKFEKVLKTQPNEILTFLRGDGSPDAGFIGKVKTTIDNSLSSNYGVVSNKKKGLTTQINQIDRNIDNKEKSLATKEDQLRKKFSKMEETMSKLQAQGAQIGAGLGGGGQ
ncbi:MAG: flagellar filament capping protein FliD [Bdellovibrionaceae bacterium]|nr:flagellar filament capping protein FliD [Pseudobdellovibrionaceae bacterium]